jgi:hypothetical protein
MSNKVLFIFEGDKTERKITANLVKCFPDDKLVIHSAYCTTIYNLYNRISKDEDLDTFSILQKMPENKETLKGYKRIDFAEVYLFFDYDGHTSSADDDKLISILNFFNEETEFGKIFISYPMVEALKHYSDSINFKELKVEGKKKISYKKIVSEQCDKELIDFNSYTKKTWIKLIGVHLKKMNFITNDDFSIPKEFISQIQIFDSQLEKFLNIDSTVSVLSSFPVFIFDYYGYRYIDKLLSE